MKKAHLLPALALAAIAMIPVAAIAQTITMTVPINGGQEVPANASTATGTAIITIDTAANTLQFDITENVANETAAHIHGPAARGVNAGVKFGLPAGAHKVGTWNYPAGDEADILAGRMYINVHSTAFPGGEIRGQVDDLSPGLYVPSLSQWGIILLSLALVITGTLFVVRRSRAIA